mmetsp:Transcript_30355/g.27612  ORF Transcript_30355/g.27612 Transcript_30355/m.27612 type:complete len:214 (+) Transcript_30355:725-1366(+)
MKQQAEAMLEFMVEYDQLIKDVQSGEASQEDLLSFSLQFMGDFSEDGDGFGGEDAFGGEDSFGGQASGDGGFGSMMGFGAGDFNEDDFAGEDYTDKGVAIPEGCTEESCPWFCAHFMIKGKIDFETLALGGEPKAAMSIDDGFFDEDGNGRRLRILADGEWEPEEGESGVEITVEADPANQAETVENSNDGDSASMLASSIMAIVATLAVYVL